MRPLCKHCRSRPASRRAKFKYCWHCYTHLYSDAAKLGHLPPDHPFLKAREARVQRMIERAEQGLPLFGTP